MITQDRLKELLHYDPDTGIFTRKVSLSNRSRVGKPIGSITPKGYLIACVDSKTYTLHRLAWLYAYGTLPELGIDHRNEIKSDNRILNLRVATRSENAQNISSPRSSNTSGFVGVCKHRNKWQANIWINKKQIRLGLFRTPEEANKAYLLAKKEYHPFQTLAA